MSWNMTDGNLVRGLLHLYFLVGDEFRGSNLLVKLSFSLVLYTFLRGAHAEGSVLSSVDQLVGLEAANIASVSSHLNAGLNVTNSGNDTLDLHESSYLRGSEFTHLGELLLGIRSEDKVDVVLPEKLGRELLAFSWSASLYVSSSLHLNVILNIHLSFGKRLDGLWHFLIDGYLEEIDVSHAV